MDGCLIPIQIRDAINCFCMHCAGLSVRRQLPGGQGMAGVLTLARWVTTFFLVIFWSKHITHITIHSKHCNPMSKLLSNQRCL